ncbi:MAG: hypothetical protein HY852_19605 [Bradyrhizobium sp.]|uniref:hypothetical protein n=1 Tax=Bradyrhizobium sp. TaxID=376 RepID=UPI0025BF2F48|nr:hypothetical protein [Bradyrhizobium sp.]MBI5264014.1 hypothetical protein [Bradyrhizobium sp.]
MTRIAGWSRRSAGQIDSEMPLKRYFAVAGGALLTLLFAADAVLPKSASENFHSESTHPTIRIHSQIKGAELVVIDTSQPAAIAPAPSESATTEADTAPESPAPPDPSIRDSFAQLVPPSPDQVGAIESSRAQRKPQLKRKPTRVRAAPRTIRLAKPPQPGLFDFNW